jgi:hypothetical protein
MEEIIIRKITGGIMGIKNGTKQPKEEIVWLNKLKPLNKPMYNELINNYIAVVKK